MRVLLVTHRFPPDGLTGVERITENLAADLTRLGDRVTVASRRLENAYDDEPARDELPDGTVVHRFHGPPTHTAAFLSGFEAIERHFARVVLAAAPEVVHFMHVADFSPRIVEIAGRLGAATVLSLQDFYACCPLYNLLKTGGKELCGGPESGRECARTCFVDEGQSLARWGLRNLYFRRIFEGGDRLISPSRYIARYFEDYGFAAERIRTVPNGISLERAAPSLRAARPAKGPRLRIAFLGSISRHKAPHLIVEAVKLAALAPVDLLLCGVFIDHEYVASLRREARRVEGLKLRIYGAYEPGELPMILRGVDCAITPSIWPETFAIVTREALAFGVPLITSRHGALPEAIVEGENGFTFSSDDPKELAVLLRRLADEPGLLERLRRGAAATPIATVAEHARAVREVYVEAIAAKAAAPAGAAAKRRREEIDVVHSALVDLGFAPEGRETEEPSTPSASARRE